MRIAVLLLCHEPPRQLARRLTSAFFSHPDIKVYIHYDAKRSSERLSELKSLVPAGVQHTFIEPRVRCHWGEYSLVEATHRLLAGALTDSSFHADHLVLLSGSCVPFRPVASLQAYLSHHPDIEFIQAKDISRERWIKDGLESERFQFYFPFNYITQKPWFELATHLQRNMGIRRSAPSDLRVHFGSQWFCLTRSTADKVDVALRQRSLKKFFQHSWIPDEFAIQSLVATLCKPSKIAGYSLTYYEFDESGKPLVLDSGHLDHLLKQPFFFARKLAPEATGLFAQIDRHTQEVEPDLEYFNRVGSATIDYQRHLAAAATQKALRARVGSTKDMWRGPMDSNRRYYYVLYSSSRAWLLHLIRHAREHNEAVLPLFDLPFDPHGAEIAGGQVSYMGFKPADRLRRDHDNSAYLYEIVNSHVLQPAAFGLDMRRESWPRDFVRWDTHATLIDCDPKLSREQRAACALDELQRASDGDLVKETLAAMATGDTLPDEYIATIQSAQEFSCQFLRLEDLGAELGDVSLFALREAWHRLAPGEFFSPPAAAWRRFWQ